MPKHLGYNIIIEASVRSQTEVGVKVLISYCESLWRLLELPAGVFADDYMSNMSIEPALFYQLLP